MQLSSTCASCKHKNTPTFYIFSQKKTQSWRVLRSGRNNGYIKKSQRSDKSSKVFFIVLVLLVQSIRTENQKAKWGQVFHILKLPWSTPQLQLYIHTPIYATLPGLAWFRLSLVQIIKARFYVNPRRRSWLPYMETNFMLDHNKHHKRWITVRENQTKVLRFRIKKNKKK